MADAEEKVYAPYVAVSAEGCRIGLMTCLRCGCVVMVGDTRKGGLDIHEAWHKATDRAVTEGP
jgi:hypothetical protein